MLEKKTRYHLFLIFFVAVHFTARQQRYVFTGVCQSFCSLGEWVLTPGWVLIPLERGWGWALTPPIHKPGILRDTVDKRAVRILLKCILVQEWIHHILNEVFPANSWKVEMWNKIFLCFMHWYIYHANTVQCTRFKCRSDVIP